MFLQTLHLGEHHLNAVIGLVASDDGFLLLVASSASSSSKGISQLPEQFPDGQRTAPRAEQVPSQLAPSPQAASSNVLFSWQQLTITDSLWNVNTLSKKSMELTLLFPEDKYQRQSAEGSLLTYGCVILTRWLEGGLQGPDTRNGG